MWRVEVHKTYLHVDIRSCVSVCVMNFSICTKDVNFLLELPCIPRRWSMWDFGGGRAACLARWPSEDTQDRCHNKPPCYSCLFFVWVWAGVQSVNIGQMQVDVRMLTRNVCSSLCSSKLSSISCQHATQSKIKFKCGCVISFHLPTAPDWHAWKWYFAKISDITIFCRSTADAPQGLRSTIILRSTLRLFRQGNQVTSFLCLSLCYMAVWTSARSFGRAFWRQLSKL